MPVDLGAAIIAATQQLSDRLNAAGVNCAVDASSVEAPGGWVQPRALELDRMDGGGTLTVRVYLVAPDDEETNVLTALGELLQKAVAVARPNTASDNGELIDVHASLKLPEFDAAMPAFTYSTDILI